MDNDSFLGAEDVEDIDRQYHSIPSFGEWVTNHVDLDLWRNATTVLATTRESLTPPGAPTKPIPITLPSRMALIMHTLQSVIRKKK